MSSHDGALKLTDSDEFMQPVTALGGVLFDLYSTLVEECADNPFYEAVSNALEVPHLEFYPVYRQAGNECMRGELYTMADRVAAACIRIGHARELEFVGSVIDDNMPLFYGSMRLYPETIEVLEAVKAQGLRTALVSNASSYSETVLDMFGLRTYFDSTILSYNLGCLKPHPYIYRKALTQLGLTAPQCLFVGDGGDNELEGAHKVGLPTVLVDRLRRNVVADYTISTLEGALPIIASRLVNAGAQ